MSSASGINGMKTGLQAKVNASSGRKDSKEVVRTVKRGRHRVLPPASKHASENMECCTCVGHVKEDLRETVMSIVDSAWFDISIGCVIALNAITIGIEQTLQIEKKSTVAIQVVESFFLVVYILELALRIFAYRKACLYDRWVHFDVALIVLGVLVSWLLEPLMQGGRGAEAFGPLMVLRTARLLRLAKTARLFKRVKQFWIMVRGFLNSAGIMFYTFVVLFVCMYVFSCLSMELITKVEWKGVDQDFEDHVHKYFRSIPVTMMTLLRFASLDNTSEVYQPIVEESPGLALFFMLVTFVVSLILFHLIGAVILSSTLEQNMEEDIQERHEDIERWCELIQNLKDMFLRLDEDGSGNLSLEEFLSIHPSDMKMLSKALNGGKGGVGRTPVQVFKALDVDKSGELSITECFDGIWEAVAKEGGHVEVQRMEKQVELIHWRLKEVQVCLNEVKSLRNDVSLLRARLLASSPFEEDISGRRKSVYGSRRGSKEIVDPPVSERSSPPPEKKLLQDAAAKLMSPRAKSKEQEALLEQLQQMWEEASRSALERVKASWESTAGDRKRNSKKVTETDLDVHSNFSRHVSPVSQDSHPSAFGQSKELWQEPLQHPQKGMTNGQDCPYCSNAARLAPDLGSSATEVISQEESKNVAEL